MKSTTRGSRKDRRPQIEANASPDAQSAYVNKSKEHLISPFTHYSTRASEDPTLRIYREKPSPGTHQPPTLRHHRIPASGEAGGYPDRPPKPYQNLHPHLGNPSSLYPQPKHKVGQRGDHRQPQASPDLLASQEPLGMEFLPKAIVDTCWCPRLLTTRGF